MAFRVRDAPVGLVELADIGQGGAPVGSYDEDRFRVIPDKTEPSDSCEIVKESTFLTGTRAPPVTR